MSKLKGSSSLLVFTVMFGVSLAYGQITPSADAYTNSAAPSTNYGANVLLDVDGATQAAYIQFNLASIPSTYTSADITKATLKLYVNTVPTAGSFNVDYVNGTWAENTISHNLAPALGTTIAASVPITTVDKNQFILIDVTPAVQSWLSGTTNDGIALVANGTFNASFDSKENGSTSHAPELDIVFAGGGLTGVTTATGSGLTGGGTSGTLNLGLMTTCASGQVLQWSGTAWGCATPKGTGTITGVTTASASGLTGGGTSGTLNLQVNAALIPKLASANTFTAAQMITGSNATQILDVTQSGTGVAIVASGGVSGRSTASTGSGVSGNSTGTAGYGVYGSSTATIGNGYGVYGVNNTQAGAGVEGYAANTSYGIGVLGNSPAGIGVEGTTAGSYGVFGWSTAVSGASYGVYGSSSSPGGAGVYGIGATGVVGVSTGAGPGGSFTGSTAAAGSALNGMDGASITGGNSDPKNATNGGDGLVAAGGSSGFTSSASGRGGAGISGVGGLAHIVLIDGLGIAGELGPGGSFTGGNNTGEACECGGDGIDAQPGVDQGSTQADGYAGNFTGDVFISGTLNNQSPELKMDDPLDPANKYLVHASVGSSEMKNMYDGTVTTDSLGHATVQLPGWFQVLNSDFRYQLTVIGQFAQAIVAREIENNQFEIRTSAPGVKVSWQVTGVRQDAYAKAHPLVVEQEKLTRMRGFYIRPELYGAPAEKQIEWARHPHMMQKIKEAQARQLAGAQKQAGAAKQPLAAQPPLAAAK
jgi:trimeric autotransporter adhesin